MVTDRWQGVCEARKLFGSSNCLIHSFDCIYCSKVTSIFLFLHYPS